MTNAAIIERTDRNYSAFVPDLPGCVATGATLEEVKSNLRQAIAWHIEAMREDNVPIPTPRSTAILVEV
jgi:predicted RNase H-like HicB family nuclease